MYSLFQAVALSVLLTTPVYLALISGQLVEINFVALISHLAHLTALCLH